MSNIPNNKDRLNDVDLSALFAADNTLPPADLDKLVLDHAHQSQDDLIRQTDETFIDKYAAIFGTAAVLMIAFALTPLTMQAPESNLAQDGSPVSAPIALSKSSEAVQAQTESARADVTQDDTNDEIVSTYADTVLSEPKSQQSTDSGDNTSLNSTVATASSSNASESQQTLAKQAQIESSNPPVEPVVQKSTLERSREISSAATDIATAARQPSTTRTEQALTNNDRAIEDNVSDVGAVVAEKADKTEQGIVQSAQTKIQIVELEPTPLTPRAFTDNAIREQTATRAQITAPTPETAALTQSPEPIDSTAELTAAPLPEPSTQRHSNEKYRRSALLWVLEIKNLYKQNKAQQAREELNEFRKQFPDNSNERLLPKELLDTVAK